QENTSMKKMLLVVCFLALASLAANAKVNGVYQLDGYCDAVGINTYGVPATILGGTHYLGDCANNFFGGGFKHGLASVYQTGLGAVVDFSDPLYGMYGINASLQFIFNFNHGQCSWVIYDGPDGVGNYVVNVGTCTKVAAPLKKKPGMKYSAQR